VPKLTIAADEDRAGQTHAIEIRSYRTRWSKACRACVGPLAVMAIASGWTSCAAFGQTLDEALAMAYQSNPTLLAARAQLRQTDEQVPQALADWRPTVEAVGGGGQSVSGPVGNADLRVVQPIYRGRTSSLVEQAENLVRAQRAQLLAAEQAALLSAATAYIDVVRAQRVVEFSTAYQQILRNEVASTRRRFAAGELTQPAVTQTEARLAGATAQRRQAEGALATAREVYVQVIGEVPQSLTMPDPASGVPQTLEETEALSPDNPAVLAATSAASAAEAGVGAAYGDLLPEVDLRGDLQIQESAIIGEVKIPLYEGGLVHSQVRASKEALTQRRLDVEAARRSAKEQALAAWQALATAQSNIESFQIQVDAAQRVVVGLRREQGIGLLTQFDVLNAELELLNARISLIGAIRDARVAGYQLLAAIGRLTARDLHLNVPYYDVERHYKQVRSKAWGINTTESGEASPAQ
jgi:TolC family type I secretion outer membrane protein